MPIKKQQILTLHIEDLAYGGRGLSRYEGIRTFTDNVVPGDTAQVQVTKIHKNYLETRLEKIITPSPSRIVPRCKHFSSCGGCDSLMLPYEEQIRYKERQVFSAIEHIAGIKDFERRAILGCRSPWFYRNKMEFSFGECLDGSLPIGMHLKGRRYDIFDLDECYLGNPWNPLILQALRQFILKYKLSPFHFKKNTGLLRSLIIREGKHTNEFMLNLIVSHEPFPQKDAFRDFMVEACHNIFQIEAVDPSTKEVLKNMVSLYLTRIVTQKGQRTHVNSELLHGSPTISETLTVNTQTLSFALHPQAFFQTNTFQAEVLYKQVIELSDLKGDETVYDLYCGTGTIGLFLAQYVKKVFAIDLEESAIQNARENAKHNNINNIDFFCGDVLKILSEICNKAQTDKPSFDPQIIVVDPPRVGLSPKALEKIVEIKPSKIIYVSCNPATLARDLDLFSQNGYTLKIVQPVDMFPHSAHIEAVCSLVGFS